MAKSSNTYSKQDSFALQAKKLGYRSRAALKLKEIFDKDRLLKRGSRVLDLGCNPGGWSQLCSEIVGKEGLVVGIDLKKVEPIKGVTLIQEDIVNFSKDLLLEYGIKTNKFDLVLSDMAPNISGVRDTDQARSAALARAALNFAMESLRQGGTLVVKLFQGSEAEAFRKELELFFQRCVARKPGASRAESTEFYLVAKGMRASD